VRRDAGPASAMGRPGSWLDGSIAAEGGTFPWHASRMPEVEQPGGPESREIEPIYRPSGDGAIVVYAGDLLLAMGPDEHVVPGNLELRLGQRSEFSAHVAGSDPWLVAHALESERLTVALPPGAALDPPTDPLPLDPPEGVTPWADLSIPINRMTVGDLRLAARLLLHVSGPLTDHPLPSREAEGGERAAAIALDLAGLGPAPC
jgi:hypothetical protein